MLFGKKQVQDEQAQEIYSIERYNRLRKELLDLRKKQRQGTIPAILSLSGRLVYDESVDDVTSSEEAQPPYKRTCEMLRPVKGMSVEEMGEYCASLPQGIGEEEYLARVQEYLENGGNVA